MKVRASLQVDGHDTGICVSTTPGGVQDKPLVHASLSGAIPHLIPNHCSLHKPI